MIDGATDAATLEMEMVYIRYLKKGQARNTFLSIEDVKHANAQGVLQTITCVSVYVCVCLCMSVSVSICVSMSVCMCLCEALNCQVGIRHYCALY